MRILQLAQLSILMVFSACDQYGGVKDVEDLRVLTSSSSDLLKAIKDLGHVDDLASEKTIEAILHKKLMYEGNFRNGRTVISKYSTIDEATGTASDNIYVALSNNNQESNKKLYLDITIRDYTRFGCLKFADLIEGNNGVRWNYIAGIDSDQDGSYLYKEVKENYSTVISIHKESKSGCLGSLRIVRQ